MFFSRAIAGERVTMDNRLVGLVLIFFSMLWVMFWFILIVAFEKTVENLSALIFLIVVGYPSYILWTNGFQFLQEKDNV